jgi:YHS domain-containing protein
LNRQSESWIRSAYPFEHMSLKISFLALSIAIIGFACQNAAPPINTPETQEQALDFPKPKKDTVGLRQESYNSEIKDHPKATVPQAKTPARKEVLRSSKTLSVPTPEGFANQKDYICDMDVMPDYTDTCRYKGKLYGFCSEYCKDKFLENPLKYLKQ